MYQVLVIPICLLLFGFLAFKQWSAILIGPLVTLILCILAGIPAFETMLGPYMQSAANYFQSYFLVFLVGALFGSVYRDTKGAQAIALAVIKVTKGRYAAAIIMLITGLLTFGGISGFVIFFAMYPIALEVFRGANVPRRLIPAAISAGCWTWSMSSPGSPAIQNIIGMRNLGTTATAAPVAGAIAGILQFVLIFAWLEYRTRKLQKNGEVFTAPANDKYEKLQASDLPKPIIALIPPVLILILFNIVELPVEVAVLIGTIAAIGLMWKHA
jgi:H+/gluconate symporter-like permease